MNQWRQRRPETPKVLKRVKEDTDDHLESTAATKRAKGSTTGGPRGRPKKNYHRGSELAAQRYQAKKAMREREEEERRGVESLLGEDAAEPSNRLRKRKSGIEPEVTEVQRGISTMSGQNDDQSDSEREQSVMEVDSAPPMADDISIYLDPALPSSAMSIPTTRTPASTTSKQPRASQGSKKSINMTLQLKYDTLVDFFREKELVEGAHFEYEYRKKIRSITNRAVIHSSMKWTARCVTSCLPVWKRRE